MRPVSREFPEFSDSEYSSIFSETYLILKLHNPESFELSETKLAKLSDIISCNLNNICTNNLVLLAILKINSTSNKICFVIFLFTGHIVPV